MKLMIMFVTEGIRGLSGFLGVKGGSDGIWILEAISF